jgi:hypothetical protein
MLWRLPFVRSVAFTVRSQGRNIPATRFYTPTSVILLKALQDSDIEEKFVKGSGNGK